MGMFSNFVAGAAETGSQLLAKSSLLDQQTQAELMKAQRVMEMQQQFKVQDEQRKRANDLSAGQDIEATSKGLIDKAMTEKNDDTYGVNDEERAATSTKQKPSRLESLQAKADAAEAKGYFDQAKEIRAQIQAEQTSIRDDKRDERERNRDDNTARYQEGMLKNNADKIQAMLANHSLTQQLAMAKAEKKLPETTKMAVDAYWKTYEAIKKDVTAQPEEVQKRLDDLEKDFMQKFPPVGFEEMKGGKVRVETQLGTSKIYDSKEAAAEALGYGKPKAAAAPDNKSSPVVDAIRTAAQDVIGGGKKSEPYTPPADSPAGKRAAMLADQQKADKKGMDEAFADAEEKTMLALKTGDPNDAQAAQDSPGFRYLPQSYQSKIFKLVNGR